MPHPREPLAAAAVLAGAAAALHAVYAATGGITGDWTAFPLAGAAVAGALLLWHAARRVRVVLAVAALPLCWLPLLVTWPVALLSLAGWLVVLLDLAATVLVGLAAFPAQRRGST